MKKELPSGAVLEITLAPFADANKLFKIVGKEFKQIGIKPDQELLDANFLKDCFCTLISSDEVIAAIMVCAKRCTYNGLKITEETFEPAEARGDYIVALTLIAQENVIPFMSGLYAQYKTIFGKMNQG